MLHITYKSPNRLLRHLRNLQRDGEALLTSPPFLHPIPEARWDVRVWRCLDKISDPVTFQGALEGDAADIGPIDLLDFNRRSRTPAEMDEILRRRIHRRLLTLASVIEKVEAYAEAKSGERKFDG